VEAKASRNRWLLVETFSEDGRQPSVIAKGRNAIWMVPLRSVMSKSRYAEEVRALVLRAANERAPLQATSSDGQRKLIAVPLCPVNDRVHGVYAWTGAPAEQPPARVGAGAWCLNLTSGRLDASAELFQLYGVNPGDRARPRHPAEAFERLLPAADEGRALGLIIRACPDDEYQGTWTIRRDDGGLRQVTISCRTVSRSVPGGRTEVVARGIAHDTGVNGSPPVPGRTPLDRQILIAEQRPGTHRVIMDPRTLRALRWIDPPPASLACTSRGPHEPGIHPDDMATARTMAETVAAGGRAQQTLRLRDSAGGWARVGVTASPLFLDTDTRAALVTLGPLTPGPLTPCPLTPGPLTSSSPVSG
jgi:hypothetical protein